MDHGGIKPPIGLCQTEIFFTNRITSLKLSSKYHGFTLMHIQSQNCILPISNKICAQNSYRVISNSPRVCMVGAWSKAVQATCALGQPSGTQAPMSPETSLLQPCHTDMQEGVNFYSKIDFLTILVLIIEILIFQFLNDHKTHIFTIHIFFILICQL